MKSQKATEILRNELVEFEDEFDTSDPEWTQVMFNRRVSTLIRKGVIRTRKLPRKVRLTEIVEILFHSDEYEENYNALIEQAQEFDNVIQSYRGEPDKAEMENAHESLNKLVEWLNGLLNRAAEANA